MGKPRPSHPRDPRRRGRPALALLAMAGLPLVHPSAGLGQSSSTAAVRGAVETADGRAVVGAAVRMTLLPTGSVHEQLTDAEGRFALRLLQPGGPYTLVVSGLGFGTVTETDIHLRLGEVLELDVTVREEPIPVEGLRVELDRDPIFRIPQVGPATFVDRSTVVAMPILSRDLTELSVLSPLVKTSDEGFSVAGQNDRYNALLIDGSLSKDVFGLTASGTPGGRAGARLIPLEAVAQYEVLVAPFDARLSGFTGGVMNAVTRTGTNEWQGSAFAYRRSEGLTGDLTLPGFTVDASDVSRDLYGFSLGGPIVRDELHLFVAAEFERRSQPPNGYNLGRDNPILTGITPVGIDSLALGFSGYGLDVGDPGPYALERRLGNIFARLDWQISPRHRASLRHLYAGADDDGPPNRTSFESYELSSNTVDLSSRSLQTTLALLSTFGRWSNEARVTVGRMTDESTPRVTWPQVEVETHSTFELPPAGGGQGSEEPLRIGLSRDVRVGSRYRAQADDLEQATFHLSDDVTATWGDHTISFGLSAARYGIDQLYLPGSLGYYRFGGTSGVVGNLPIYYERTFLADSVSPRIGFSVWEFGAHVQDEVPATDEITLTYGLRIDVPVMPERPAENLEVQRLFGKSTSVVPTRQLLFSPRLGFRWQDDGPRITQVRGGVGLFQGRPPFVWLANAYANTGLRTTTLVCDGGYPFEGNPNFNQAPAFTPDDLPTGCVAQDERALRRTVTLFDENFQFPQDIKISIGVDRQIIDDVSASAGFLFSRALNQVFVEDINIGPAVENQEHPAYTLGYGGRPNFGDPAPPGSGHAYVTDRLHPEYAQVLHATNRSDDYAYAFTAEVRGSLSDRLRFQAGYAYARSYDRASLTYNDMLSNFGVNAVQGHPNRPELGPSRFDRPHKVVAALHGNPVPWLPDTEIALLYTGESGLPYSYVYRGDLNGDGYPGSGPAFDRNNDLLYVPEVVGETPMSGLISVALFESAIVHGECLRRYRGSTIPRNACRAPWQNRLDLRVGQSISLGPAELRVEGDLINVLNVLDGDWGLVREAPSLVPVIEPVGRSPQAGVLSYWSGGVAITRDETGDLIALDPFVTSTPESQWQAQIGARVTWR